MRESLKHDRIWGTICISVLQLDRRPSWLTSTHDTLCQSDGSHRRSVLNVTTADIHDATLADEVSDSVYTCSDEPACPAWRHYEAMAREWNMRQLSQLRDSAYKIDAKNSTNTALSFLLLCSFSFIFVAGLYRPTSQKTINKQTRRKILGAIKPPGSRLVKRFYAALLLGCRRTKWSSGSMPDCGF